MVRTSNTAPCDESVYGLTPKARCIRPCQTQHGPCDGLPQGPQCVVRSGGRYFFALNCVSVFFFSLMLVKMLSRQSGEPSFLSWTVTG